MSMNLIWCDKKGKFKEHFQYQTPTELTHGVLNETNKEKQFELIKDEFMKRIDPKDKDNVAWAKDKMDEVKQYLFDDDYVLGMI